MSNYEYLLSDINSINGVGSKTSKLFKNCDHRIPATGANLGLDLLSNEMVL